jgi:hypothetical protein
VIRSAAEIGEQPENLGLLADRIAQTHVLAIYAATIRECCGERASQPAAPPGVRRTGCGLFGPDMTAGQPGRQHHGRRATARRPYVLRADCMAACCLRSRRGRRGAHVESEIQGLHTEALQCAGYYGSRSLALRDRFAALRGGNPLSACPVARGEPARGGGCRAWAPTDQ